MTKIVQLPDVGFFSALARAGSLTRAGRELGISTAAVSKHLAQMEERVGVPLVNRTTRRMGLTPEGELYLEHARRVVGALDELEQALGQAKAAPKGLLRVNATLGFGRSHVAPLVSRFAKRYPEVEVQLQLTVNPPPLTDDVFDVCVRFGAPPESRLVARHLGANRRLLCATPGYLMRHGTPKTPDDLARHQCITIRQGDEAYGVWRLRERGRHAVARSVKVRGALSTNDGGIAVSWALEGHGILMRAEWDIERHLKSGRLVQVLPQFDTPDADIHAVYPQRHQASRRVRVFVDFLATAFAQQVAADAT
ncbi:MAG: LysR family transcriptional regulator [Rhodoferax sp.]|jgi:LysR family transcriptional regulator, transcriptional activator for dmlA|nr:LysR family transcriptional regulator [Rhodoferax sp.]